METKIELKDNVIEITKTQVQKITTESIYRTKFQLQRQADDIQKRIDEIDKTLTEVKLSTDIPSSISNPVKPSPAVPVTP